jgi:hypothetical protein
MTPKTSSIHHDECIGTAKTSAGHILRQKLKSKLKGVVLKRFKRSDGRARSLMILPLELHLLILRFLLWQPQPLGEVQNILRWEKHNHDNADTCPCRDRRRSPEILRNCELSPQILRVCRRLYGEGLSILYDNTVACSIWGDTEPTSYVRSEWAMRPPPKWNSYYQKAPFKTVPNY